VGLIPAVFILLLQPVVIHLVTAWIKSGVGLIGLNSSAPYVKEPCIKRLHVKKSQRTNLRLQILQYCLILYQTTGYNNIIIIIIIEYYLGILELPERFPFISYFKQKSTREGDAIAEGTLLRQVESEMVQGSVSIVENFTLVGPTKKPVFKMKNNRRRNEKKTTVWYIIARQGHISPNATTLTVKKADIFPVSKAMKITLDNLHRLGGGNE